MTTSEQEVVVTIVCDVLPLWVYSSTMFSSISEKPRCLIQLCIIESDTLYLYCEDNTCNTTRCGNNCMSFWVLGKRSKYAAW